MLDLYNNKYAFLKKKPSIGFAAVIILILILLWLLIYMCKKEIYDTYQAKGIVTCSTTCQITTAIPSNIDFEQIMLNNKNLDYEFVSKELKVDEEAFASYYEITLSTKESFENNEIVNLNFYYNKEKIITKIKEKMF